jgi:threonine dehydrogenase-like Zn-dependent dehydrogenase
MRVVFSGLRTTLVKEHREETIKKGDLVVAPFAWSDSTCEFCQRGLQTSCLHGGWWGGTELDGGQAKRCAFRWRMARSSRCLWDPTTR